MSTITIQLDDQKTAYRPGEPIRGTVAWTIDEAIKSAQVRLVWFTAGRGDRNIGVVQTVELNPSQSLGQQRFDLSAPKGPYSFSGKLISLVWAIEAVIEPKNVSARQEIVISPSGETIDLQSAVK